MSAFVNPLQFGDPKDLENYPRTPVSDIEQARLSGASLLWLPTYEEIYPGPITQFDSGDLGAMYEGAFRKGHFSGMLTVVNRLFDLVQPRWAIFGEKDFQQLFLIKKMVRDLGLDVEIIAVPTVRASNGLAISSRNVRLRAQDIEVALVIYRALANASQMGTVELMQKELEETLATEPDFARDYSVIINEEDFSLATDETVSKRALIAGWVNGVRLIDTMSFSITPSTTGGVI